MHFKNIALVAAALSSSALAEFVIITDIPTPTNLADLTNPQSWISSLENFVTSKIGELSANATAVSQAASAHTALASFVATASYSIPSEVTELGALQTFTTTPDWYSALPSNVRAYYDANNARVASLLNEAILGPNATTTSAGASGASASRSASGAAASQTGAAAEKIVGMIGAGVAAAFAGVMAL